jgi:hypothetical protein
MASCDDRTDPKAKGVRTDNARLLAEVDDLMCTMPERAIIRHETPEHLAWFGRAAALVEHWQPSKTPMFTLYYSEALGRDAQAAAVGLRKLITLLNQMRTDLLLRTRGPLSMVVDRGMVFDYFDELRKIIEPARQDVFFVDPYLDADFVSRYLPHVAGGANVRLLTREKLPTLMPAVRAFVQQSSAAVEVRSAAGFHDRYIFVDRSACYQSGASFKDGGRTAPTTLTQITDAFVAVLQTYEAVWASAIAQN